MAAVPARRAWRELRQSRAITFKPIPDSPLALAPPADLGLCPVRTQALLQVLQGEIDRQRMTGRDSAASSRALAVLPPMYQPASVGEYNRATDVLGRVIEVNRGQSLVYATLLN
ncbi:MAG: hypothetical protein RIS90_643 [Pseudomonadota bacterium]